jgi:hypothetical protein
LSSYAVSIGLLVYLWIERYEKQRVITTALERPEESPRQPAGLQSDGNLLVAILRKSG